MKNLIFTFMLASLFFSFTIDKNKSSTVFDTKKIEKSLALIPKGLLEYKTISNTKISKSDVSIPAIEIDSYYISKYEVSNQEYINFLNDTKEKNPSLYASLLPDSTVWLQICSYGEPIKFDYFRHPAYSNYPVVGISYEQAVSYCKWLTSEYMNDEKRKFKHVKFSLPDLHQWTYASKGGKNNSPFPWEGTNMQNKKGQWLANFKVIKQNNIQKEKLQFDNQEKNILVEKGMNHQEGQSQASDVMTILAPVSSYFPNGFGLYNMAGNAEEYVKEKGITKGGSWLDTGYYLQTESQENYNNTNYVSPERGFRYIMTIEN